MYIDARADKAKLVEFALEVLEILFDNEGSLIYSDDIQSVALRLGVIEPYQPSEPCSEICNCYHDSKYSLENFADGHVTCNRTPLWVEDLIREILYSKGKV